MKKQASPDEVDFYTEFVVFISDQFARPKRTHHDYMISTAYAEYAMNKAGLDGVAFPSVQTRYYGQNVVLKPTVVDKFLTIEVLSTQRVYKNRMNNFVANHKNCANPGDCADNIVWTDLDPQFMSTKEDIEKALHQ